MANPENIAGQGFHTHPERRNNNGKPKGTRNRSTIVREALEAILEGTEQQVVDAMTAAVINKAITLGDVPAFKELMDSAFGKVPDKVIPPNAEDDDDLKNALLANLTEDQLKATLDERSKTAERSENNGE